jgi:hypothetical protein
MFLTAHICNDSAVGFKGKKFSVIRDAGLWLLEHPQFSGSYSEHNDWDDGEYTLQLNRDGVRPIWEWEYV